MSVAAEYVLVALLGVLVGAGELVSRYRDEPARAVTTASGMLYLFLNAAVAMIALVLVRGYGWTYGASDPQAVQITQILAAGFGAMALFRSSLFNVHIGSEEVGIGPSSVLQVVLTATDRAVDRARARARDALVSRVMANVSFDKAYAALPAHCLALMQNLPQDDQKGLANQIVAIRSGEMPPRVKSLVLGLALLNVVGEDVLRSAVASLGSDITA